MPGISNEVSQILTGLSNSLHAIGCCYFAVITRFKQAFSLPVRLLSARAREGLNFSALQFHVLPFTTDGKSERLIQSKSVKAS